MPRGDPRREWVNSRTRAKFSKPRKDSAEAEMLEAERRALSSFRAAAGKWPLQAGLGTEGEKVEHFFPLYLTVQLEPS